jgi:hypothetical protein
MAIPKAGSYGGLVQMTRRALHGKVAVPTRLPDAGRLTGTDLV